MDEHTVYASSFADPEDVYAFKRCKSQGHSDSYCFALGDNGIGAWGDDCSEGSGPSCALSPEVREYFDIKHLDPIIITKDDKTVTALVKDTMPHISYLEKKGLKARIDLNPDCCAALNLTPPVMTQVTWKKG